MLPLHSVFGPRYRSIGNGAHHKSKMEKEERKIRAGKREGKTRYIRAKWGYLSQWNIRVDLSSVICQILLQEDFQAVYIVLLLNFCYQKAR